LPVALKKMLDDSQKAKALGSAGRVEVRLKYSNERLAIDLVENLLAPLVSIK